MAIWVVTHHIIGRHNRDKPAEPKPAAEPEPEPEPEYVDDQDQGDQFRTFFPSEFGKKTAKVDTTEAYEATKRKAVVGPVRPARLAANNTTTAATTTTTSTIDSTTPPVGPPKPQVRDPNLVGPPRPVARDPNLIGPPRPPPGAVADDSSDEDEDDEEEEEEEDIASIKPSLNLPISYEIELKGHIRPISALTWDPSGARLLTGGFDYTVKFWDFGGVLFYRPLVLLTNNN